VAQFTRELSVMLQAGQDVDHALRFLVETCEHKRARAVLRTLRDSVRGGRSLAQASGIPPSPAALYCAGARGRKLAAISPKRCRILPICWSAK